MEPCCTHRWTDKMGHNLKAIMKVMRFAVRRGKTIFNLHSLISNQTVTSKLLKYPFDNDKKYLAYKHRPQQYDTTSMIPWCTLNNGSKVKSWHEYSRDEVKPCSFFQVHSFSNRKLSLDRDVVDQFVPLIRSTIFGPRC